MKLQHNLNLCKKNMLFSSFCKDESAYDISNLDVNFQDISINQPEETIRANNILVLGFNYCWNSELALLLQRELASKGYLSRIIDINEFDSIKPPKRTDKYLKYIVLCDEVHSYIKQIQQFKAYFGTKILFNIERIVRGFRENQIATPNRGTDLLKAIGVAKYQELALNPITSLVFKEFFVVNENNITKRSL